MSEAPQAQVRRCEGFTLRVQPREDHLRFEAGEGIDTREVSVAMWRAIVAECLARGEKRCLVIESLTGEPEDPGAIDAVVDAYVQAGGAALRCAFVEATSLNAGNEACEVEGLFRDLEWRAFVDETSALRWLRYGS